MQDVDFYANFVQSDSEFYEPAPARFSPRFLQILRSLLPREWRVRLHPLWLSVSHPSEDPRPRQGWKIHISCVPDTAEETLRRAVAIFVKYQMDFKCSKDPASLKRLLSKRMDRTSAGKFITAYPVHREQFVTVLGEVAAALDGFEGPDILSDRRYSENAPVFYRYGAFSGYRWVDETGAEHIGIKTPDGSVVPDQRLPYFELPVWIQDPFFDESAEKDEDDDDDFWIGEKYKVLDALHYTNSGGTYLAQTADGEHVVLKEARPSVAIDRHNRHNRHNSATERLKNEFDILSNIRDLGIAPKPLALFAEESHLFLALEFLAGEPIEALSLDIESLLSVAEQLSESLIHLESRDVAHTDLSPANVLRTADNRFYLIDFELAVPVATPEAFKQDIYGFGTFLLWCLVPINNLLALKPDAPKFFLEEAVACPAELKTLILKCLQPEPELRPDANALRKGIQSIQHARFSAPPHPSDIITTTDFSTHVNRIIKFIKSTAQFDRRDRLFPADPRLFSTNPLSCAFGACGIALTLKQIDGETDSGWHEDVLAWILSHNINITHYPPGLYIGIAGISAALFELGEIDYAAYLMKMNLKHPLLPNLSAGLMYGIAGLGLACLVAYKHTKDERFLDSALNIGKRLKVADRGRDEDFSLGQGSAGISYFYCCLSMVTGDRQWVRAGEEFMQSAIKTVLGESDTSSSTYLHGRAGVLSALIRWESHFPSTVTGSIAAVNNLLPPSDGTVKWSEIDAVNPSFFYGDSGVGQACLDAWLVTGDARYRRLALQIGSQICLGFGCERENGLAMPGRHLLKLSDDFATGAAGVLPFLINLMNLSEGYGFVGTGFDVLLGSMVSLHPRNDGVQGRK